MEKMRLRRLGVRTTLPTRLLEHLLVLVLAHLLAPLLDYRTQRISSACLLDGLEKTRPAVGRAESYRTGFYQVSRRQRRPELLVPDDQSPAAGPGRRAAGRRWFTNQGQLESSRMYFKDAHEELRLHIRRLLETSYVF
jgi:hypothetical protein